MTPREKAKELNHKMSISIATEWTPEGYFYTNTLHAKQCSLIAVDEMINQFEQLELFVIALHWSQVKREIEKL